MTSSGGFKTSLNPGILRHKNGKTINSAQLNQMIMNLLLNAVHAIDGHGHITVSSGCDTEQVWVEISDNGTGIPPENMGRIFEPFFTTKQAGLGTGLGLVAVFNTVTHHHGKVEVSSEPGTGTTFRIRLPIRQRGVKNSLEKQYPQELLRFMGPQNIV